MNVIGEGFVAGVLIGGLVALVFAVLVGGATLLLAVLVVEKFAPGYGRCCASALTALLICLVAQLALGGALYAATISTGLVPGSDALGVAISLIAALIGLALAVLASALAIKGLITRPDGSALAFGRALRVAAVFVALLLVAYVIVVAALLLLLGGVPGVSR